MITEDLDLGKGRYRLKGEDGVTMKTAVNCHRLKLWVDPNGGKLKPPQERNGKKSEENADSNSKPEQTQDKKVQLSSINQKVFH